MNGALRRKATGGPHTDKQWRARRDCSRPRRPLILHRELVTSEFILEELCRKLIEKFGFPAREADQVAAFLRRAAIVVIPADLPAEVCRDPIDVPVLSTAVGGECSLLISVDRDLLDMQTFDEIPIVRPGEYWRPGAENH